MRTLLKVLVPVETGNQALKDGSLPQVIEQFVKTHQPEAAYFTTDSGRRCAMFVLDLKDASDIPSVAEPFFKGLNAEVSASLCMNLDDLKSGIEKAERLR